MTTNWLQDDFPPNRLKEIFERIGAILTVEPNSDDAQMMNELVSQYWRLKNLLAQQNQTHERENKDRVAALELLDKAGVWTGADDNLADRVQHLILDRDQAQQKAGGNEPPRET